MDMEPRVGVLSRSVLVNPALYGGAEPGIMGIGGRGGKGAFGGGRAPAARARLGLSAPPKLPLLILVLLAGSPPAPVKFGAATALRLIALMCLENAFPAFLTGLLIAATLGLTPPRVREDLRFLRVLPTLDWEDERLRDRAWAVLVASEGPEPMLSSGIGDGVWKSTGEGEREALRPEEKNAEYAAIMGCKE